MCRGRLYLHRQAIVAKKEESRTLALLLATKLESHSRSAGKRPERSSEAQKQLEGLRHVRGRANTVYPAKLGEFRDFTMKLKSSEIVLLLGPDPVIATGIVIGVEEIPDGARFTMRTRARVSRYSKLHGRRGKFEISRVEQKGDRWIVEGKRLGSEH